MYDQNLNNIHLCSFYIQSDYHKLNNFIYNIFNQIIINLQDMLISIKNLIELKVNYNLNIYLIINHKLNKINHKMCISNYQNNNLLDILKHINYLITSNFKYKKYIMYHYINNLNMELNISYNYYLLNNNLKHIQNSLKIMYIPNNYQYIRYNFNLINNILQSN